MANEHMEERHIPQPEDVVGTHDLDDPRYRLKELRCHFASGTDTPCLRLATVSTGQGVSALCDAHAIATKLAREVDEWGITEEITYDWLSVAEAWGYGALIRLARVANDEAKEHKRRAQARMEEAFRVANAAMVKA